MSFVYSVCVCQSWIWCVWERLSVLFRSVAHSCLFHHHINLLFLTAGESGQVRCLQGSRSRGRGQKLVQNPTTTSSYTYTHTCGPSTELYSTTTQQLSQRVGVTFWGSFALTEEGSRSLALKRGGRYEAMDGDLWVSLFPLPIAPIHTHTHNTTLFYVSRNVTHTHTHITVENKNDKNVVHRSLCL